MNIKIKGDFYINMRDRLMFYYPSRAQAMRIQETLKSLYESISGEYYFGESAWNAITERTGIDLLVTLKRIADEKENSKS